MIAVVSVAVLVLPHRRSLSNRARILESQTILLIQQVSRRTLRRSGTMSGSNKFLAVLFGFTVIVVGMSGSARAYDPAYERQLQNRTYENRTYERQLDTRRLQRQEDQRRDFMR